MYVSARSKLSATVRSATVLDGSSSNMNRSSWPNPSTTRSGLNVKSTANRLSAKEGHPVAVLSSTRIGHVGSTASRTSTPSISPSARRTSMTAAGWLPSTTTRIVFFSRPAPNSTMVSGASRPAKAFGVRCGRTVIIPTKITSTPAKNAVPERSRTNIFRL